MKAYHLSETLKPGDILEAGYHGLIELAEPFIKALEQSSDCFYGIVLNAKYTYAVLSKSGLREWADYAKWATEAVFEFIRKIEFPSAVSRLKCCFFYDNLENVKRLYEYDWGDEPEEIQNGIHLFEVELNGNSYQKYDVNLFNLAYDEMEKNQDLQTVLTFARKYFVGEHTETPTLEILTDKNIKITKDVTNLLR